MLNVNIGTECQDCIAMLSGIGFKKFHEGHAPTQIRMHKSEKNPSSQKWVVLFKHLPIN